MKNRPRSQRRPRVPGTFRTHEQQAAPPTGEPSRITIYLDPELVERLEQTALAQGSASIQRHCETLLRRAIEAELPSAPKTTPRRHSADRDETVVERLQGLDAIIEDPDFVQEWSAQQRSTSEQPSASDIDAQPMADAFVEAPAVEVILHHAGIDTDNPFAFLATLRRGEPIATALAEELLQALQSLERDLETATTMNRKLAYALHKLAFEAQVLVSDAWPAPTIDAATLQVVRLVQEAVDRVLSGLDIRYYRADQPSGD